MTSRSRSRLDLWKIVHSFRNEFFTCLFKIQNVQVIQNDVIKCCKMMSSNVALLHSNNCCVLEPAICEDLDLHVVIYFHILRNIAPSFFLYNYWKLIALIELRKPYKVPCLHWDTCNEHVGYSNEWFVHKVKFVVTGIRGRFINERT